MKHIALKEFHHILRDARSLVIVLAMPVMMTFLYGYAINMDIENVVIGIVDHDRTPESRELIGCFYNSTYFSKPDREIDETDFEKSFREEVTNAILIIKPGFGRALKRHENISLGLLIDGSDNNLAVAVQNYSQQALARFQLDRLPPGVELPGVGISPQVLYNPDLQSSHFVVPGLVAIILLMISALLTSITIAREKETGTMEQLLTAPVRPVEILIGKILPYIVIALLDGVLVLVFAKLIFGVPFVGSYLLLLAFGLIYVTTALSIGILISSLVKTQQIAMMFAITTTMLPSVMLSGFIFAIKNMPSFLQLLSRIIPATYFLTIIRGIMLKGASLEVLAVHGAFLLLLMALMMTIAAKKFNTRIA
ncbi:MAG: ABC transporter permease [candidate division Zixibacteria bacterium]|nr:ABC transporter permease [candidate division Zixibacteria bacterium]